jgi:hypothetical protein
MNSSKSPSLSIDKLSPFKESKSREKLMKQNRLLTFAYHHLKKVKAEKN